MATRTRIIDKLQVITEFTPPEGWSGGGGGAVDSVNGQTGVVVLDADDIDDTSTTNKFATAAELTAIATLTAGAVMEADTSTASMSFVVDEDDMSSNLATKVPTQQSVKAYVDNQIAAIPGAINVSIGDGVYPIEAGVIAYLHVPAAQTITGWTILADVSGSIVVDVWKDSYANFPPTVADTIAGANKPTLSSAQKNQVGSLSWAITAGDVLAFKVDSASTVTRVSISFTLS
jgi:hypothetical protein